MRIKSIEVKHFKRFTHLKVDNIPETAKLVVLVGPNGSGKTSFMEAMNHFHKYSGYNNPGDSSYFLKKETDAEGYERNWVDNAIKLVDIQLHDREFKNSYGQAEVREHFYFRSAYRNEPSFQLQSMQKQGSPTENVRLERLIQNDLTVSSNYQRLVANTVASLYDETNNKKSVEDLRNELTGKIRESLSRVFDDLDLTSLGKPLNNGTFYFTKGIAKDFDYKNLSAGEKSAFDLILDMVVQSQYYPDAVYCIDEPELHMHTRLQGKVLRELYNLVPGKSQLWVSTHSIGMLQEAEAIGKVNPGEVVFLNFGDRDFDSEVIIQPSHVDRAVLEKFYELAFGDFAKLILPKTIIFCEGTSKGGRRKDFDKEIYTTIFSASHTDSMFISGGSCTEIENIDKNSGDFISTLLKDVLVIRLIDRDDNSDKQVAEYNARGIKVLKRRNLESYMFDDAVIKKLCDKYEKSAEYQNCIEAKKLAIKKSIGRGNPHDDIKSAKGDVYLSLKRILGLTQCGNSADAFMRDTLAKLITKDMAIFKELESVIFG